MSEWQRGDLALCVNNGPLENSFGDVWPAPTLKNGRIYTVECVGLHGALWLVGLERLTHNPDGSVCTGYNRRRFRKIEPHTPDEEDAETILLMRDMEHAQPVADGWWAV